MSIQNALASMAVKDLESTGRWYEQVLERPGSKSMPEVTEWVFPRGGGLQVYQLPERAGACSCTLIVDDIDAITRKLESMGVDTRQRSSSDRVRTLMVTDPDGNHIAFAQPFDPSLAR